MKALSMAAKRALSFAAPGEFDGSRRGSASMSLARGGGVTSRISLGIGVAGFDRAVGELTLAISAFLHPESVTAAPAKRTNTQTGR